MPSKNIVKRYAPESYYHVYTRGVNKQPVFLSEHDYTVFLSILKRYLSKKNTKSPTRHVYRSYSSRIELLSYALMNNHIHLLVYQTDERSISDFMRSVLTSYSMYFNKRYRRVGPVFESRYKASLISDQGYLEHISRYIHLNPKDWLHSEKTSLKYYLGQETDWVRPRRILDLFSSKETYLLFLEDYESHKQMLDELKWELANDA